MDKLKAKRSALIKMLVVSLVIVTALIGCGQSNTLSSQQSADSNRAPQKGGVFKTWMQDDPRSLDPAHCGDIPSWDIQMNIYDGLLKWDKSGQKIIPDLAVAMPTVSNGGLTYTFRLRQGIKFQNGDPFTADDVVYSINRLASKSIASEGESYYSMIKGMDDVFNGRATTVSGVVKKGEYTVEFDLNQPTRTFLDHKA
ncbi:periplasmic oligopeptide-binding protein precursor [Peptococcaceae bacterium CEB3]|nr:periplasmic oligopeptide-binding protein precursor [Peptococcaceae bacterium CEB3]